MSIMNKPLVVEKLHKYRKKLKENDEKIGKLPRSLAIDYNNACNLKCDFCYEREEEQYNHISLDLKDIERIADEASELGVWEIVLQGGELLINVENTLKIIQACKPERFKMILVTNGYYLNSEVAECLVKAGLDCVGVSVSSLNAEEHDSSRKKEGAHRKAIEALDCAKNAGLDVWTQVLFGHHNSKDKELYDFLDYLKEKDIATYFILAMPYGVWKDTYLDAEDIRIFNQIRKEYKCNHDIWNEFDRKKEKISGCWALNRMFITPLGDVLPCPFINIKIGNIHEHSLKEILDYGFRIKYFGGYSPVCLAAQNRKFREKYLEGCSTSMFKPSLAADIFNEEDFE